MRTIFLFNFSHLDSRAMGVKVIKINASNYHNSVLFITGSILSKILVCFAELGYLFESSLYGVARSRTRLSDFTFTFHFDALEKKGQPTLVFLPGGSQRWWSLVGCRLWGRTESDTTEATQHSIAFDDQYHFTTRKKMCNLY